MIEKIKQLENKMYGKKIIFFLPLILIIILILAGLAIFLLASLGGSVTGSLSSPSPMVYQDSEIATGAMREQSLGSVSKSSTNYAGSDSTVPAIDRKIIKNASLNILVDKVESSALKIQAVAEKYNGLVDSSDIANGNSDTRYGTMIIRVPNESFNAAIGEIEKIAIKVNSERISSEDVTAQYIDLEARLKSKKAVEEQYVALLKKADKVAEIVTVQSYLNTVREDIERLQGQINYLSNQVSMSSITISMTSQAEVQILGITWQPLTVIKQSFRDLLEGLAGIIDWLIATIFALPVLLIKLGIFVGLTWLVIKILKGIYRIFWRKKVTVKKIS